MSQSIGSFARSILATEAGLSNQQVLERVKAQFPDAKTSIACIAWYKSNMKKTGFKAAPVERTPELIQKELDEAKLKVEILEAELEEVKESMKEKLEEEFKRLAALLGKEVE